MQDIFLSTAAPSAGSTGIGPGGVGAPGSTSLAKGANGDAAAAAGVSLGLMSDSDVSGSEGEGSFGATLSGVFNSSFSAEKLNEIASKLEALGLDPSFLDDLGSLLGGNLLSVDGQGQGTSLPHLSSFLSSSLSELEQSLGFSSEDIPEDVLNSLLGTVNSIQKAIDPLGSQFGLTPRNPDGADATVLSMLPKAGEHMSAMRRQLQANTGVQNLQTTQHAELDVRPLSLTPVSATPVLDNPELSLDEKLFNSMSGESFVKNSLASDGGESAFEKVMGNVVERSQGAGLKATFTDTQQKLDNAPYSTTVMSGLNDLEWSEEVGQKIVWLTGKAIQSAEIHLNPAELGPIDVKISVQNDVAAVTFNAHNASVREMLESNVTRLREMMESNGVELQEVNVDARQGDERYASGDQQQASEDEGQHDEASAVEEEVLSNDVIEQLSSNIVDYFA